MARNGVTLSMPHKRTLSIASDHAGFDLKEYIIKNVTDVNWIDEGPHSTERTDYPDYAEKVALKVSSKVVEQGVLVCGSGIGMCIAANKFANIRAAVVESEQTARLAREHNDANVLCLGARILQPEYAKNVVNTWLKASFEGGRHAGRLQKITELEKKPHGTSKK